LYKKQGVTLTGCNNIGPPSRRGVSAARRPPAVLQTTTDASEQNNTGVLCGPVIMSLLINHY